MLKAFICTHITIIIGSFTPSQLFTCHLFLTFFLIFVVSFWKPGTNSHFSVKVGLWTPSSQWLLRGPIIKLLPQKRETASIHHIGGSKRVIPIRASYIIHQLDTLFLPPWLLRTFWTKLRRSCRRVSRFFSPNEHVGFVSAQPSS